MIQVAQRQVNFTRQPRFLGPTADHGLLHNALPQSMFAHSYTNTQAKPRGKHANFVTKICQILFDPKS